MIIRAVASKKEALASSENPITKCNFMLERDCGISEEIPHKKSEIAF